MKQKTFITSDNIKTFAKVQNAAGFTDRGEIILAWDDLDRSQRKLAKNIDIPLQVRTSDPRSVPNKWSDNIVKQDKDPEAVDFIKQIIANPSRYQVWEMLKDYNPPEPLILWWIDKTYTDDEYFARLAEACRYGLFRGDTKYLWAVVAFGVEEGRGRFHWPSGDKEDAIKKNLKQKVVDVQGIRPKEIDLLWDDVKHLVPEWVEITPEEADYLGLNYEEIEDPDPEEPEDDNEEPTASSLLDL